MTDEQKEPSAVDYLFVALGIFVIWVALMITITQGAISDKSKTIVAHDAEKEAHKAACMDAYQADFAAQYPDKEPVYANKFVHGKNDPCTIVLYEVTKGWTKSKSYYPDVTTPTGTYVMFYLK